jgi:uncharacterized MAPEG superfamily protein
MTEYYCLAILSLLFLFAFLPSSIGKAKAFGGKWLASNRKPIPGKELPEWAARCERAHNNLKDNYPAFIAAVLILGLQNKFDAGTASASVVYVVARILHFLCYGIGNVLGRAIFYFVGLGTNIYLLVKVF